MSFCVLSTAEFRAFLRVSEDLAGKNGGFGRAFFVILVVLTVCLSGVCVACEGATFLWGVWLLKSGLIYRGMGGWVIFLFV
jgi:hypothetical protein